MITNVGVEHERSVRFDCCGWSMSLEPRAQFFHDCNNNLSRPMHAAPTVFEVVYLRQWQDQRHHDGVGGRA